MNSLRRLVDRQASLNKKLRKAVISGKHRVVAELLEQGASSTWLEKPVESSDEMNALLLACHGGDAELLDLLLDSFFEAPQLLSHWGRHMYCIVIRNGHWKTFRRLYDRHVPLDPTGSTRSKLPSPAFIAAEVGQSGILQFLVKAHPVDAAGYSFNGHSLLTIASKNGHYDCVDVLLSMIMVTDVTLDYALDVARVHNQPHIVVLLTSCLPQYNSNPSTRRHSITTTGEASYHHVLGYTDRGSLSKPRRASTSANKHVQHNRGSLAETDILSDDGDERTSSQDQRRSTWLYQSEQDLHVYHPYLDSDDDEMAHDPEDALRYEAYIHGLETAESEADWTTTPPVPRSLRALSIESEEKTEETLTRIAERRETVKGLQRASDDKKKPTWFYHNEVILPYDDSAESATTTTVTPTNSPPLKPMTETKPAVSAKPPLPPPTNAVAKSFHEPTAITRVSRKIISVRSKSMQLSRASM